MSTVESAGSAQARPDLDQRHFARLETRRNTTVLCLVLLALAYVVAVIALARRVVLIDRFLDGDAISLAQARSADHLVRVASIAVGLTALVTAISFIAWYYRAYANLGPLGARSLRYRPGWAIGAWFVPLLNLVHPKQMADDIWRGSDPNAPAPLEDGWNLARVSPLLHWWWGLFIGCQLVERIAVRVIDEPSEPTSVRWASIVQTAGSIGCLVAVVLAALVVWRITRRQTERAAALRWP